MQPFSASVCPDDRNHQFPTTSLLIDHLLRCPSKIAFCATPMGSRDFSFTIEHKNYEDRVVRCPFNRKHCMIQKSLEEHKLNCEDRKVDCPFSVHHQVKARKLEEHKLKCDFRIEYCCFNKRHRIPFINLEEHESNECGDRIVTCPFNSNHTMKYKYLEKHQLECSDRIVVCPFNRNHRGTYKSLENHKLICEDRMVKCPFSNHPNNHHQVKSRKLERHKLKCDFRLVYCRFNHNHQLPFIKMEEHESNECSERIVLCPFNSSHQIRIKHLEVHKSECMDRLVVCPFNRNHHVRYNTFENHKLICEDRMVKCPFSNHPNNHQVKSRNLERHKLECDFRLVYCRINNRHEMPFIYLEEHESNCNSRPENLDYPNNYHCGLCKEFSTKNFDKFIEHLEKKEDILNIQNSYSYYHSFEHIRVFSYFYCKNCNQKFNSSATACNVERRNGQFYITKEYGMYCKKCSKEAQKLTSNVHFINQAKYLSIKYYFFPKNSNMNTNTKELIGHEQSLCDLCKELGYLCVTERTQNQDKERKKYYY